MANFFLISCIFILLFAKFSNICYNLLLITIYTKIDQISYNSKYVRTHRNSKNKINIKGIELVPSICPYRQQLATEGQSQADWWQVRVFF